MKGGSCTCQGSVPCFQFLYHSLQACLAGDRPIGFNCPLLFAVGALRISQSTIYDAFVAVADSIMAFTTLFLHDSVGSCRFFQLATITSNPSCCQSVSIRSPLSMSLALFYFAPRWHTRRSVGSPLLTKSEVLLDNVDSSIGSSFHHFVYMFTLFWMTKQPFTSRGSLGAWRLSLLCGPLMMSRENR